MTRYNSKTVQDRRIVSIKVEYEVICTLSNGCVADDLEWPITPQTTQIVVAFHIFVVVNVDISNLVHSSIADSPNPLTTNRPWKGRDYDHVNHLNSQYTPLKYLRNGYS